MYQNKEVAAQQTVPTDNVNVHVGLFVGDTSHESSVAREVHVNTIMKERTGIALPARLFLQTLHPDALFQLCCFFGVKFNRVASEIVSHSVTLCTDCLCAPATQKKGFEHDRDEQSRRKLSASPKKEKIHAKGYLKRQKAIEPQMSVNGSVNGNLSAARQQHPKVSPLVSVRHEGRLFPRGASQSI